MKKTFIIITIFICNFFAGTIIAQWSAPNNLNYGNSSAAFLTTNAARGIIASGNNLFVVWHDNSLGWGNSDVWFRRSTNNGTNWGDLNVFIFNSQYESKNPSIAYSSNTLHLVWEEYRDGNPEIYYKRSTNNGANWGSDIRLTNASGTSDFPAITVSGTNVHVVWRDNRDGNPEIYYKRSTNNGVTWLSDVRFTNNAASASYPSIHTNGNYVHVTFPENRDGNNEIYYKRSTTDGATWGIDTRLTNNSADSWESAITGYGSNLYMIFCDNRISGRYHLFIKKSTNNGASWNSESQVTSQYSHNFLPSIVVNSGGNNIHISYTNTLNNNGYYDSYYIRSTNGGVSWGSETRISSSSYASYAQIAVTGTNVFLVERYRTNDNWNQHRIRYYKNPTGNPTGIQVIKSELPESFSISQNYPNPFNPATNINFSIPKSGFVKLIVYDMMGKIAAELVNGNYSAGTYKVDFDASRLSSGTYFYKITAGEFSTVKKMTLVK